MTVLKSKQKNVRISFSVGICAYNEEKNIEKAIISTIKQKLTNKYKLYEILIISSGSTDSTNKIVMSLSEKYPVIKLIRQKKREGKASAVNLLIKKSKSKILILQSADLIIDKNCFQQLLKTLEKPYVGMVGGKIKPLDNPNTFCGYSNHLRWKLHHLINIKYPEKPKVGELIAFKKLFSRIPPKTATDEASIEPLIRMQDFLIRYVPNAIVYNKGPQTVRELLSRRRSIFAGHFESKMLYGYEVITFSSFAVIPVFLSALTFRPKELIFAFLTAVVEITARIFGVLDVKYKMRDQSIWKIAKTTKDLK